LQGLGMAQPSYVLVQEAGPEHSKTFTVEVRLNNKDGEGRAEFVGRAQGTTKKTAEQDAARQLLAYLASRPQTVGARTMRGSRSAGK
jgi:ribonuclease-3